jgi:hypothetical protein
MLNGQSAEAEETEPETETEDAALLEFLPAAECARRTGLGMRFLLTLHAQGHIRREQSGPGWRYCIQDAEAYRALASKAKGAKSEAKPPRSEYETELQTLVTGYKDLLGLQNAALKQAQQHERDLFAAFTGPLKVVTEAMQAQVTQLTERANAGDTARVDFIVATEGMLRDNREEEATRAKAEATRVMREKMWADLKTAAPHLWKGVQQTFGFDDDTIARAKAGEELKSKLDEGKVAALFAFDFLSEEEKDLLCKAFGYDRAKLEAMAKDAGASEVVGTDVGPAKPESETDD